jgi:hypothetical protein
LRIHTNGILGNDIYSLAVPGIALKNC